MQDNIMNNYKNYELRRERNRREKVHAKKENKQTTKQRHDKVLITLYQPKISMNNGCRIICWNIL